MPDSIVPRLMDLKLPEAKEFAEWLADGWPMVLVGFDLDDNSQSYRQRKKLGDMTAHSLGTDDCSHPIATETAP